MSLPYQSIYNTHQWRDLEESKMEWSEIDRMSIMADHSVQRNLITDHLRFGSASVPALISRTDMLNKDVL